MSKNTIGLQYLASEVLEKVVSFIPAHPTLNRLRACGNRVLWTKLQRYAITSLQIFHFGPVNSYFIILPTLSSLTALEISVQIPHAYQDFLHHLSARMKRLILLWQPSMDCWLENTLSSCDGFEIRRPMVVAKRFPELEILTIRSKGTHSGWPFEDRRNFLLGLPPSLVALDIQYCFFEEEVMASYLPPNLTWLTYDHAENFGGVTRRLPKHLTSTISHLTVINAHPGRIAPSSQEDYTIFTSLETLTHFSFEHLRPQLAQLTTLVRLRMEGTVRMDDASLNLLPRSITDLWITHSYISQSAVWPLPLLQKLTFQTQENWTSLKSLPPSLTKLEMTTYLSFFNWDETSLQLPHLTHLHLTCSPRYRAHNDGQLSKFLIRSADAGDPTRQATLPPRLAHLTLADFGCSHLETFLEPAHHFVPTSLKWLRHLDVVAVLKESQIYPVLKRLAYFKCSMLLYEDGSAFLQDTHRHQLVLTQKAGFSNGALTCSSPWGEIAISFECARSIPDCVTDLRLLIPNPEHIAHLEIQPEHLEVLEVDATLWRDISKWTPKCVKLKSLLLQYDSPHGHALDWPPLNSTQLETLSMPIILSPTEPPPPQDIHVPVYYMDPSTIQLPPTIRVLTLGPILGPLPSGFDSLQHLTHLMIRSSHHWALSWKPESIETVSALFQQLPPSITHFEYGFQIPPESSKWLKCAPDHLKYFKTVEVSERLVFEMSRFLLQLTCNFVVMERWSEYLQLDPLLTEIQDMQRFLGGSVERALTTPMQLICLRPLEKRHFQDEKILWHAEELTRLPSTLTKLVFSERCQIRIPRMAHLLPPSLTTLILPSSILYFLSTPEIRRLPATLQTLHCSAKYFSVDSFAFLPASLTNLHIFGGKKFTSRFAAALPKTLRRLKMDVFRYFPTMVRQLPATLTYLSVTTQLIPSVGSAVPAREDYPNIELMRLPGSA